MTSKEIIKGIKEKRRKYLVQAGIEKLKIFSNATKNYEEGNDFKNYDTFSELEKKLEETNEKYYDLFCSIQEWKEIENKKVKVKAKRKKKQYDKIEAGKIISVETIKNLYRIHPDLNYDFLFVTLNNGFGLQVIEILEINNLDEE